MKQKKRVDKDQRICVIAFITDVNKTSRENSNEQLFLWAMKTMKVGSVEDLLDQDDYGEHISSKSNTSFACVYIYMFVCLCFLLYL